jgi:hypothetical protein
MCVSFLGLYVNRSDFQKNGSIFIRPLLQPEIIIRIHVKKAAPSKDGTAFQIACISDLRYRMFSLQDIELCELIDLRCEEVGCISLRGLYVMEHLF